MVRILPFPDYPPAGRVHFSPRHPHMAPNSHCQEISMSYNYEERQSRQAWDDDWQPESEREGWQAQRRRQEMTPGQTSYGGPARQSEGYSDQYGAGRYPDRPSGRGDEGRYESRYGSRDANRDGSRQGSREDGRYGRREEGREEGREMGRNMGRDMGRSSAGYGSNLRYGLNGGYGSERAGEWRDPPAWQRERRQLGEGAERASEPRESARSGEHDPYFRELRSDTRYWTDPSDDWDEVRRYDRSYGRESARRRGWEVDDDAEDEREDHGVLYNVGRRIGEAVGDLFGNSEEHKRQREHSHERYRDHEHERHAGPRGYQRSDDSIRDKLCERLSYARGVDVSDVSVDVSNGVVSLSGTVRDRSQKYYIEELADDTYGVTEVSNDIRVRRESTGMIDSTGSPGST
jgi:hypothetical protein